MITLEDGTPVFGMATELDGGLIWLDKAFFIAGSDSSDVNLLRPFGMEVHRPQQLLVIPWSSVLYQEPLLAESPAVEAITTYLASASASSTVEPDLARGSLSAVFLTSGEVFFGGLTASGDQFQLDNAHFLRFKDESDDDERTIDSLDDIELIPEAQASAGSTGAMLIPAESVLYIQMLASDSPVAGALAPKP
jgi:hypothetical protein